MGETPAPAEDQVTPDGLIDGVPGVSEAPAPDAAPQGQEMPKVGGYNNIGSVNELNKQRGIAMQQGNQPLVDALSARIEAQMAQPEAPQTPPTPEQ